MTTNDTLATAASAATVPGVGWTNSDISPQGAPSRTVATSSASSAAAAGDVIDVDAGDEDKYSYFGEFPNPDPTDDSPLDISNCFTHLFVSSNKCSRKYSKPRKIQILYDVLSIDKSVLLGDSPPPPMRRTHFFGVPPEREGKKSMEGPRHCRSHLYHGEVCD